MRRAADRNKSAFQRAYLVRFGPILMTGVAVIAGAAPIALGYGADGASRMPLGLVVVGGLVFSQVVTLFVTPSILHAAVSGVPQPFRPFSGRRSRREGQVVGRATSDERT